LAFAEVIVDINHHQVDKVFDYLIPARLANQVAVGKRVLVPFNNREIIGFVMGLKEESNINGVKPVYRVLDQEPVINADLVKLAKWIAQRYFCQQVQVLKSLLPEKIKSFKTNETKYYSLSGRQDEIEEVMEKSKIKAPVQYAILNYLAKQSGQPVEHNQLKNELGHVSEALKALIAKKLVRSEKRVANLDPFQDREFVKRASLMPNDEQAWAIQNISGALLSNQYSSWLLYGITGSGKTEVYLQVIVQALKQNKDTILLVPEISLTPQTVERFKERFGNLVAVMHSKLTAGEKLDQWWKIKTGQVKIVVGARSAIFAPFNNLGLIIIDEEHDASYKQEETPRYHTKEVAMYRGQLSNSVLVLGSATPSLESFYEADKKEHQLLSLTYRTRGNLLPEVKIVDLREELRRGNRSIFSMVLQEDILDRIAKREQIILFLNRRGYSTFVNCRECGYVAGCPHCTVSLTLHSVGNILKCHYCDYSRGIPLKCPKCGSSYIRHFGVGTQKVEEEVKKAFPHARVLRMDVDTTRKKGSHEKILDLFRYGRADILIGTQMVAKGLDFPRVSLVGVLAADLSLNLPDFRACERTFQLVVQVSGRAGRDEIPGKVIIQTYLPENYAINCAKEHDYLKFYQLELGHRRKLGYPPFSKLVRIVVVGSQSKSVELHIGQLSKKIQDFIDRNKLTKIKMFGPMPAPISKLRNQYRWHILLNDVSEELFPYLKKITDYYHTQQQQIKLIVDVDPRQVM
jgi:primosomal protein N' (replication factor Y)